MKVNREGFARLLREHIQTIREELDILEGWIQEFEEGKAGKAKTE